MGEKHFTMRMSDDLYQRIEESAKQNHRSVAKEIQLAIESYLMQSAANDLQNAAVGLEGDNKQLCIDTAQKLKDIADRMIHLIK